MQNRILYIVNGVLVIAVGVLFFLHFSNKSGSTISSNDTDDTTKLPVLKPKIENNPLLKEAKVVYVNQDTLLKTCKYYQMLEKEIANRKAKLEANYKNRVSGFQSEMQGYQQKANQMTEDEMRAAQQTMQMKEQQIMSQSQDEQGKMEKEVSTMHKNIDAKITKFMKQYALKKGYRFILTYSSAGDILYANDSLDVTSEVVNGLNENYLKK